MPRQEPTYFTGADARLVLLNHPDEAWRGKEIDCAFFQLTAGATPSHLYNYARREGPTMSDLTGASSDSERLKDLAEIQTGESGGAPFDDTALGNLVVQLQLVINESRFETTYYKFRSMSEIGDLLIKYDEQVAFDRRAEAGYTLVDGRVQQVGRQVSVDNTTNPSIQIQFRNLRPLGSAATYGNAPSEERGGSALSPELQAAGLGQAGRQGFYLRTYQARIGGKEARPAFTDQWPESASEFGDIRESTAETIGAGRSAAEWVPDQSFQGALLLTEETASEQVWRWTGGRYVRADISPSALRNKARQT